MTNLTPAQIKLLASFVQAELEVAAENAAENGGGEIGSEDSHYLLDLEELAEALSA